MTNGSDLRDSSADARRSAELASLFRMTMLTRTVAEKVSIDVEYFAAWRVSAIVAADGDVAAVGVNILWNDRASGGTS